MKRLTWIRKRIKVILVLFALLSTLSYASYYYVTTTWIVSNPDPSVTLDFPLDNVTINVNTTEFNWTGDGGNATLRYVFYIDSIPTFTSPNLRAINRDKNTSYTPEPLEDGHWYWRVEVSDGEQINVSETRHLIVNTVPPNNFPSLTNMLLSPSSGTTITLFYYNVTYTDIDNDSAEYVRVYIDGNPYDLSEVNPSDSDVTDGKAYTYSTTLNISSHTYLFMCSDGNATNTTSTFFGPTVTHVVETCPESSNEQPANKSTLVSINVGYWNITITDDDGETTNGSIECSSGNSTSWSDQPNGIKSLEIKGLTYDTLYTVWVNFTDGNCSVNETYWFRTNPLFLLSNPYPANESTDECPALLTLCITVYTASPNKVNLTFWSNLSGSWDYFYIGIENTTFYDVSSREYCIYVPFFDVYGKTYFWNASLFDGTTHYSSPIYKFTTNSNPDDCDFEGGTSEVWIVGVAIVFSIFGILAFVRRRK